MNLYFNLYNKNRTLITKLSKNKLKLNKEESQNNEKKSSENINQRMVENKNDLLTKKEKLFSSRNKKVNRQENKTLKSANIKSHEINDIFHPIKQKSDKMSNTGISFYRNNLNRNNIKRNYSAYYIKSDLILGQKYLSDFLIDNSDTKIENSKISEIEQKIRKLGRTLNLNIFKKNKSYPISRTFSSFPLSRNAKKKIFYKLNNNNFKNIEEEKNKSNIENHKKLPDYLKHKFNIKGYNILSPFCMKARDSFIFKKFNRDINDKNNLRSDNKYINNKLNIMYAENEEAYYKKLALLNRKLIKKGKIDKYHIGVSPTEQLLRDMEKKVTLMKNIVEYAYPNTTLMRMRISESKKYFKKYKYKYDFKHFNSNIEKLNEAHSQIYILPDRERRIYSYMK